jgi:hypothetical protein
VFPPQNTKTWNNHFVNTNTLKCAEIAPKTVFDALLGKFEDISEKAGRMPRDAAILYPPKTGEGRLEYQGVVRLSGSGAYYWAFLRILRLEPLAGLVRFVPWDRPHPFTRQQPDPDSKPVSTQFVVKDGTHLECCTKKARIEVWPRLAKGKQVFEVILSPAQNKEGHS